MEYGFVRALSYLLRLHITSPTVGTKIIIASFARPTVSKDCTWAPDPCPVLVCFAIWHMVIPCTRLCILYIFIYHSTYPFVFPFISTYTIWSIVCEASCHLLHLGHLDHLGHLVHLGDQGHQGYQGHLGHLGRTNNIRTYRSASQISIFIPVYDVWSMSCILNPWICLCIRLWLFHYRGSTLLCS